MGTLQEKQTKEALTRKQQKCRRKNQDEEAQEAPELLKRPREYSVRFTFPDPPPLSPPVLGLHGEGATCEGRVGGARRSGHVPGADPLSCSMPPLRCDLRLRRAEATLQGPGLRH